jgi:hypothetical protein
MLGEISAGPELAPGYSHNTRDKHVYFCVVTTCQRDGRTSPPAIIRSFFETQGCRFCGENSKEAAAKNFNVCARRIPEWYSKKDQLHKFAMDSRAKHKRLICAGGIPLTRRWKENGFNRLYSKETAIYSLAAK